MEVVLKGVPTVPVKQWSFVKGVRGSGKTLEKIAWLLVHVLAFLCKQSFALKYTVKKTENVEIFAH